MQVSIISKEGLEHKLKVVVPSSTIETKYQDKLKEVSKSAKIDGFRKGKVSSRMVEQRYGQSVRYEVIDNVMREALFSAIEQEKLNPAGRPTVESVKAEPGQDLEFEAVFEIYPEVSLKELAGKEIEKISAEVTDKDVDNVLEKLRKQRADWVEVDRAARSGDEVIIDFDGYANNEQIKNGKAENAPLILGSNIMIPGFEDGIIGAKAGDQLEVHVTFPVEYHEPSLAGKPAEFKIKVHQVREAKLPELNDEFAKNFGVREGGMEALKKDLRKHMTSELENLLKSRNKEKVFTAFLEANEVQLPKALVESELEALHASAHQHHHHGHDHDHHECKMTEEERTALLAPAERRVKLGLLVAELIKKHELKPDAERVRKLVEGLAGSYENPEEFVKWYYTDKKRMGQVEMMAVEDQALEKLLEGATVKVKEVNYDEAISRRD